MLRAISETAIYIDSEEYAIDGVPDNLLTDEELSQVRSVVPGALPDYVVYQPVQPDEEVQPNV